MQARLEVLRGAKTKHLVLRLPTVIGRGNEANLKLPAATVSRHHCEIYVYEGQIVVRDLGSSNGTVVNGHRIMGPTFLTVDDELTIGPVTMRLETMVVTQDEVPSSPANAEDLEEVLPDLDALPDADAMLPVTASAGDLDSDPLDGPEDSVLRYAEPADSGRSFVDISAPVLNQDLPVIEADQATDQVAPDDRALNDFLKKIE